MASRRILYWLVGQMLCVSAAAAQPAEPRDQPKLPPPATAQPLPPPADLIQPAPPATAPAAAPAAAQPSPSTPPAPGAPAGVAPANPSPASPSPAVPSGPVVAPPAGPGGPAATGSAPLGAASPGPIVPPVDVIQGESGYQVKLRGLEEKVNELKEKVFRSKARLVLLQEAVLHGSVTGAYALLVHKNTMGSSFKLEYASYHLDGQPIYQPTDTTELEKKAEFPIFNGAIVPGQHTVSVYLAYRGASSVFAYWQGYQFKIKSSFTFHYEEGKITQIKIVGYEKGGVTIDLKDRPAVRFDVDVQKVTQSSAQGLGPAQTPPVVPVEAK